MTLMLNIGKWGGIYFQCDYTVRLCLGWIAFTFIPDDIDFLLQELKEKEEGK